MRGIKPETFTDDKVLRLTPLARWLFVGMWTLACDNGHLEDNAVQLKVRLLPMDACDIDSLLSELLDTGQVERHDGYLKVVNLPTHQRIDRRFLLLCEWCEHDERTTFTPDDKAPRTSGARRAHDEHPSGARSVHVDEGEGEGEKKVKVSAGTRRSAKRPIPEDWKPNAKHQDYADERGLDLSTEAFRFRNHAHANDRRQVDWDAAFRMWLSRAKDFAPAKPRELTEAQRVLPEAWR